MRSNAIRLARENLRRHKARSRLSIVGIIISVFIISLVFIISDSFSQNLTDQINSIDSNTIIINGARDHINMSLSQPLPQNTINEKDNESIKRLGKFKLTRNLFIKGTANSDRKAYQDILVVATSTQDPKNFNARINDGSWISQGDDKKWIVLGENLAHKIIGTNKALNQIIEIKGQSFTAIGVLKKTNQPFSIYGFNVDDSAFISVDNGQSLTKNKNLNQIIISNIKDNKADLKSQVTISLGRNHIDSSDYVIETGRNTLSNLRQTVSFITNLAAAIGGLILLISSVSITNIMMVNMVERKREIGIRKAVGATNRNIINQFMVEAIIMSLRGGVIGLILAYIVSTIGLMFISINICLSWRALLVGFTLPIIIGIIAGIYPAHRAAKQNIIQSLNEH